MPGKSNAVTRRPWRTGSMIREELVSGTRGQPVEIFTLGYEAATREPSAARLTVRRKEAQPASELPSSAWTFVDARSIRLLPEGTRPTLGSIYELYYQAKDPKVLGLGFAATRDFVSFLRYAGADSTGVPNPARGSIKTVLAVGISQSGRYLRDHVAQGFNQDESGKRVFDGVLAHISGVGRVFLNAEFGQPGRTNTQHEDHLMPENEFPFSTASMKDPVSGKTGALLRGEATDPYLIEVNTSTEYWQKGASLLHTDPLGRKDVALPSRSRVYMLLAWRNGFRTDELLHLTLDTVTRAGAEVLGIEGYGLDVGCSASFVIVPGETLAELVVARPTRAWVVSRGRVVARDGECIL